MAAFKVLSTNHTSFTVSDLERSVAFYRDILGFEVTSIAPRDPQFIERVTGVTGADILVAYVRAPGHSLELIEYRSPEDRGKVQSRPCDTGFAHVAFDVDDVDAATAAIEKAGVVPINRPQEVNAGPNKGRKVVYARDPDGVTIELIGALPH